MTTSAERALDFAAEYQEAKAGYGRAPADVAADFEAEVRKMVSAEVYGDDLH